jgi:thiol-disulfide isomerase/thioredoxin
MRAWCAAAVFAASTLVVGADVGSAAVPAPRVHIATMKQLPTPLPYPYEEAADADAQVAAAFARARTSGKRVLIDLGGNWCADCRIIAGVMELPEMKPFMDRHYEYVAVDVGRFNKNMHIPARYGLGRLPKGVPTILIADADGKAVNIANAADLESARSMTPQGIADWLARWAKP